VQSKDVDRIERLRENYGNHYLQCVKLKAIQKEQERFRCSVIQNSRQVAENVKRSEMVKCVEDCVFLRISSGTFNELILPLIREELDVKLFCLQRLQLLSVFFSANIEILH